MKGGPTEVGMASTLMLDRMVEILALLLILGDLFIQVGCQLDIVFGHIVNESIVFDKPEHLLIARDGSCQRKSSGMSRRRKGR